MKIVRLDKRAFNGITNDKVVVEVIPDYALPVEKWYGKEFAAQCVEAPDEVEPGWTRSADGTWSAPEEPAPAERTLEDLRTAKLAELNAACDAAIASGCDVTLSDGTAGHISLTIADQINLSTAQGAVASGAAGYAYHLDGALCEIYPAADIAIMASAATAHVLYHQTYCNHARQWAKRCTTEAELEAVTYGAALPDDLAEHMAAVLAAAKEGADA